MTNILQTCDLATLETLIAKIDEQIAVAKAGEPTLTYILDGFTTAELRTIRLFVRSFVAGGDHS